MPPFFRTHTATNKGAKKVLRIVKFQSVCINPDSSCLFLCLAALWRSLVALDAPRHLFLHTVESIELLAKQAGFKVADLEFDSTTLQFVGSELYLRDIPLKDGTSDSQNPQSSIFSAEQLQDFKATALKLNKTRDGDQACFYLYKE